jgi:hemerythrin superfamily protein
MTDDVITLITADHRKVEELFTLLKAGQGDQAATVAELHALLIAHARAEEDRVYPGIDAHHGLEEHKEAEILLDALKRAEPGTPEFAQTLDELVESVSHHVQEEESTILPLLAKTAGEAGLKKLGLAFRQRRQQELQALTAADGDDTGDGGEPTKAELYEQAQQADIPGRSQMSKKELEKARKKAGS